MVHHPGALAADLHRFHRLSLAGISESGIPLREVAAFAANLPPQCATHRAVDPHWARTNETELLRAVEFGVRVLIWQQTEAGSKGHDRPEPVKLPWDTPNDDGAIRGDVMTWEEAAAEFGWEP